MITIFDSESPFFSSVVCDTSGVGSEPDKDSETNPTHRKTAEMTAYEFKTLLERRDLGESLTRSEASRLAWEVRKAEKRIARSCGYPSRELARRADRCLR